jgi:hypothetical protein
MKKKTQMKIAQIRQQLSLLEKKNLMGRNSKLISNLNDVYFNFFLIVISYFYCKTYL